MIGSYMRPVRQCLLIGGTHLGSQGYCLEDVNRICIAQLVSALTICTRTIATVVILETGGDRENVAVEDFFNSHTKHRHSGKLTVR